MFRIAVLASGTGTNLQAIIDGIEKGSVAAEIACVISDRRDAMALERARKHSVDDVWVNPKEFKSREEYDRMLSDLLKKYKTDLIVLAGFMRILSKPFVAEFYGKIVNIHPALLPKYPGTHSIQRAFEAKEKITGVTVHFVDDGVDTGPIIKQIPIAIVPEDTVESLEERVHQAEHKLYPEVIKLFAEGRISLKGRRVVIE